LPDGTRKIFFERRLDTNSQSRPVGQITPASQRPQRANFGKSGLWTVATLQTPTEDEALVEQALVEQALVEQALVQNGGAFDAHRF
jgi:hypothetical protein